MKIKFVALSALAFCCIGSAQAQQYMSPRMETAYGMGGNEAGNGNNPVNDYLTFPDSSTTYHKSFPFRLNLYSLVLGRAFTNDVYQLDEQTRSSVNKTVSLFRDTVDRNPAGDWAPTTSVFINTFSFSNKMMDYGNLYSGDYHFEVNAYNFNSVDGAGTVFFYASAFEPMAAPVVPVIPAAPVAPVVVPEVSAPIIAAVPEPETYALMLAGLGALGLVARRRKSL